jgi:hypothetical protein
MAEVPLIGKPKMNSREVIKKPDDVKIEQFAMMAVPGQMQGVMALMVHGLGDDSKMYQYDTDKKEWNEI